jgi:hypothetical protein
MTTGRHGTLFFVEKIPGRCLFGAIFACRSFR